MQELDKNKYEDYIILAGNGKEKGNDMGLEVEA